MAKLIDSIMAQGEFLTDSAMVVIPETQSAWLDNFELFLLALATEEQVTRSISKSGQTALVTLLDRLANAVAANKGLQGNAAKNIQGELAHYAEVVGGRHAK